MSKKLIIGNWKMNPSTLDEAKRIARKIRSAAGRLGHAETVICPPFPFMSIGVSKKKFPNFRLGAQSASYEEGGPHTGEVGAAMLRSLGTDYVIVGHSEERAAGDTDDVISRRAQAVLSFGMMAVVCVGEKTRDENGAYLDGLKNQIKKSLAGIMPAQAKNIVIAYEPVWAIGAKEAMLPAQIYETSLFVKKVFSDIFGASSAMKVKVLYGGSVNFRNAPDIMKIGKVDGLLVGRESVNNAGFVELLKAVDQA